MTEEKDLSSLMSSYTQQFTSYLNESLYTPSSSSSSSSSSHLSNFHSSSSSSSSSITTATTPSDEYQASIMKIDEEIMKDGGSTGGWDARDHDIFLKVIH
jgi:hypothetical protein